MVWRTKNKIQEEQVIPASEVKAMEHKAPELPPLPPNKNIARVAPQHEEVYEPDWEIAEVAVRQPTTLAFHNTRTGEILNEQQVLLRLLEGMEYIKDLLSRR